MIAVAGLHWFRNFVDIQFFYSCDKLRNNLIYLERSEHSAMLDTTLVVGIFLNHEIPVFTVFVNLIVDIVSFSSH